MVAISSTTATVKIEQIPPQNINIVETINKTFTGQIAPIMRAIAYCESGTRQYDKDGKVLISKLGTDDRGIFQIHAPIWLEKSKELGYDIHTIEGDVLMAKYILETQGHNAWKPSKDCWSKLIGDV